MEAALGELAEQYADGCAGSGYVSWAWRAGTLASDRRPRMPPGRLFSRRASRRSPPHKRRRSRSSPIAADLPTEIDGEFVVSVQTRGRETLLDRGADRGGRRRFQFGAVLYRTGMQFRSCSVCAR